MNEKSYHRWMTSAKEDLDVCSIVDVNNKCYHAQQTIKKVLYSALIFTNIEPPYTNDLKKLVDLVPDFWKLKTIKCDFDKISQWYKSSRYPGYSKLYKNDADYGVDMAEKFYNSVKLDVENKIKIPSKYKDINSTATDIIKYNYDNKIKDEELKSLLHTVAENITKHLSVEKIVLYGSHARGTTDSESDIDLMIVLKECNYTNDSNTIIRKLVEHLHLDFDVFTVTEEHLKKHHNEIGYMYRNVLREGVIIYG